MRTPVRLKVLLIEDNPADVYMINRMLSSAPGEFDVVAVPALDDGLRRIREEAFDVMLLALKLTDSRGIETLEAAYAGSPGLPIIVLTGLADERIGEKAVAAGAQDYLIKGQIDAGLLSRAMRYAVERKRAEEERQRQMEMINLAGDAIIIRDYADDTIAYWNKGAERLYGWKADEVLGKNIHALLHTRFPDSLDVIKQEFLSSGNWEGELLHTCREGRQIFALSRWTLQRDAAGNPAYFLEINTDITARRHAEEVLKTRLQLGEQASKLSEDELLRTVLDEAERLTDSSIGFFHYVAEDQINLTLQMWSTNTVKQMCSAEGKGKHYAIADAGVWADCFYRRQPVVHNDYESLPHKKGLPEGHAPVAREVVVPVVRDNKVRAILGVGNKKTPYNDDDVATVAGFADMIWEVVSRRRAELDLVESKENLSMILDSAAEGIYGLDGAGGCTFCNAACLGMLGYPRESDLIGKKMHDLVHHTRTDGSRYAADECAVHRVLTVGEFVHSDKELLWRADGRSFPAEYWAYPIVREGKIVGAVVTFVDITERLSLEHQLRQAQKMESVGTLAGGIAHDFNNILSAIIGYAHVVISSGVDDRVRSHIEQILDAAQRAAVLTKGLLTFSRKQVIDRKMLGLNAIVRDMEKLLARMMGEDIELEISLCEGELPVLGDRNQIEQVLMNLATNARDAMPNGGSLRLTTGTAVIDDSYISLHGYGKPGEYALLTASDTGSGMDEETRARIFEPFFTTKEQGKGTGLGLAVLYGIVKQHEGYINVYSEPGMGTTFKIYLPLSRLSGEEEHKPVLDAARPQRGTETVLLAEDDNSLRKLMRLVLTEFGYDVIDAADGEEAVRKFVENKERVGLLLCDLIMPRKNGKEVYDEIRKIRPDLPVIFSSGYAADIISGKGLIEEGVEMIFKPVSPRDLLQKVREVLDKHRG